MKTLRILSLLLAVSMLPAVPAAAAPPPEPKTLLDASAFIIRDENLVHSGADYLNPASVLFDDQDKAPESQSVTVSAEVFAETDLSKNWKPNWQAEFGEDSFYIDLGANYKITGIAFLDNNGVQDWLVEDGEPFAWQELTTFTTDSYQCWCKKTVEEPRTTRWLRFSTAAGDSGVAELAIYGELVSPLSAEQQEKTAAHPSGTAKVKLSAAQQIGFNAFIDDPMTAIMAGGNVREYHNLSWLFDSEGKIKFKQDGWGDMDAYYAAMKQQNISIIPCFQGNSAYIFGEDKYPEIAVKKGDDTLDPASYTLHAQAMYQVAARYGSNKEIDPATLNVAEGSEPKAGLGLLDALENSNEPNKSWSGKVSYYTPYEMAALCSADYDGHEGLIENAGVKTADPSFRLAVGGLLAGAGLLDYLSEMKLWFDYHRTDGKFAVDIINIHMGPDTYNPEDSGFMQRVQEIKKWMTENAPGTELWISEFEVPMGDMEKEDADMHDDAAYQLRYAQRVARTYLMAIGAGVDRMTKFQLRDEGEGVYYNSGLTTGKGEWKKKLAWYYTACMTNVLQNTYFAADMTEDEVKKYFFINNATGESVYALWLPTNEDKTIKDYQLTVPAKAKVYLTVPGDYAEGKVSELTVTDTHVTLDISETPVFVSVGSAEKQVINGRGKRITPQSISTELNGGTVCDLKAAPEDAALAQAYQLFDEPDSMPKFFYDSTAGLDAPATIASKNGTECYVKFDQPYVLTGIGLFDTYGSGNLTVTDANTGETIWSSDLGSYMTYSFGINRAGYCTTDAVFIHKDDGALNELAFYGYRADEHKKAFLRGDVNCDEKITVADAVLLARIIAEDTTVNVTARGLSQADCNADDNLTTDDTTALLKALAGLAEMQP